MRPELPIYFAMTVAGFVLLSAQIAITRLLAASIGSDSTFAVIGFVMLGLAVSGTRVFIHGKEGKLRSPENALVFAGASFCLALLAFIYLTSIPFIGKNVSIAIICSAAFVVPFYFVGYFITVVLERFAADAPKLYAVDLGGAALGAVTVVFILDYLSPQTAIIGFGVLCAVGSVAVRWSVRRGAVLLAVFLLGIVSYAWPVSTQIRYASTTDTSQVEWDKWDHFGHASVLPYPEGLLRVVSNKDAYGLSHIERAEDRASFIALGWAMSRNYNGPIPKSKYIRIDSGVGTPIVAESALETDILTYDVTAAGFASLEKPERVGIVGTGGGRDILTARRFGATEISAFEINEKVVEATEEAFRDLSGGPYSMPGVSAHLGDARSEIRGSGPFQLVVLPMTDTFSATSSGALVFSENGLYTLEAFETFFDALDDDGVLSVSRFYSEGFPGEIARISATAREAVKNRGGDPKTQILVVFANALISKKSGVANVLVKKEPFTDADIERVSRWVDERGFKFIYKPGTESELASLISDDPSAYDDTIFDVSAIRDDRPFFYDSVKLTSSIVAAVKTGDISLASFAVRSLAFLFLLIALSSKMFVIDPIRKGEGGVSLRHWTTLFFVSIGAGFLMIELAIIQRCTLFLGHPTYALTVVLSCLLIASSIGSAFSNRLETKQLSRMAAAVVTVSVIVAVVVQPWLIEMFGGESLSTRVLVVIGTVAPIGVVMGMLYPTALRRLSENNDTDVVPWCWAVNGTAGVLATTAGMFIAMRTGYTVLLLVGILFYVLAAFAARLRAAD